MSKRRKGVKKVPKKTRKVKKIIEKPFADGSMSSSAFFGFIRSALRQKSRFFKSINNCRLNNRIPYIGPNKRRKWTYICQECGGHFDSKEVAVHHIIPAGTLTTFEDLPLFVKNLFCNSDKLKLVCNVSKNGKKSCHDLQHEKLENQKIIENYGNGSLTT